MQPLAIIIVIITDSNTKIEVYHEKDTDLYIM